jgi:hypothetical protein
MKTREELAEAILSASLIAHSHPNGADWLECPFCSATQDVKGYASNETIGGYVNFPHYPGCIAKELDDERTA